MTTERIEEGFKRDYDALVRDGVEKLLALGLGELLWDLYRRGYVLGHADRSREVHQEARNTASLPLAVSYEDDRLIIAGREIAREP